MALPVDPHRIPTVNIREADEPSRESGDDTSEEEDDDEDEAESEDEDEDEVEDDDEAEDQTDSDEEDSEDEGPGDAAFWRSSPKDIMIGIDFGTTHSGFAWALRNQPTMEPQIVDEWRQGTGISWDKCPTVISYDTDGKVSWGFKASKSPVDRIEGVKLLLDPGQQRITFAPATDAREKLLRMRKNAINVAADFLSCLRRHAERNIKEKQEGLLEDCVKKYVLTVPAVWSDQAKDRTKKAAHKAGIKPVVLVTEPEAAAHHTVRRTGYQAFQPGDAFVVCDAGGGTTDTSSYEVVSSNPLRIKELTVPDGCSTGSMDIDNEFQSHVKGLIGDAQFARVSKLPAWQYGLEQFRDVIKRNFGTTRRPGHADYVVFHMAHLPNRADHIIENDTLKLTQPDLKKMFDKAVNNVLITLRRQVDQARSHRRTTRALSTREVKIFLVGGLGMNAHLRSCIVSAFPRVIVRQPTNAWSAIVRGAVLYGLSANARGTTNAVMPMQVVSNFASKHYGVGCHSNYDPVKDARVTPTYDTSTGTYHVDAVYYFISKGTDLPRARLITHDFFRDFEREPKAEQLEFDDTLWECELHTAPRHRGPGSMLKVNCVLHTDLSNVPRADLSLRRTSRRDANGRVFSWWRLEYQLIIKIRSGPMLFSSMCNGKEYSVVEAEYNPAG